MHFAWVSNAFVGRKSIKYCVTSANKSFVSLLILFRKQIGSASHWTRWLIPLWTHSAFAFARHRTVDIIKTNERKSSNLSRLRRNRPRFQFRISDRSTIMCNEVNGMHVEPPKCVEGANIWICAQVVCFVFSHFNNSFASLHSVFFFGILSSMKTVDRSVRRGTRTHMCRVSHIILCCLLFRIVEPIKKKL